MKPRYRLPCNASAARRAAVMPGARQRGFTLVEVLVALLIMAVISTMAWQGIDGIVRARDISQAQMERTLRLNTVIAQWEQDLMSVHDTVAVPPLAFDGSTLRLVRATPAGVQMVAWALQGTSWRRWTGPVVTRVDELQESWMRSQQLLGNEQGQLLLLEGVTEVQVQFFVNNAWSNSQSSGDMAPPTAGAGTPPQRELLPAGVRLILALGEQRLTRDLALAPQLP
ncbi:MAG TPA: prepilin-type N-terminal cleavage/methylation domain-containing protein [Rubrivivax sp.]|nr:prepilin-type N-terminal cleavage/methylation domain-containing protein [Rubrivivax sp.]